MMKKIDRSQEDIGKRGEQLQSTSSFDVMELREEIERKSKTIIERDAIISKLKL